MRVPREQVSVALFNLFKASTQLKGLVRTITRFPRMWTDVGEGDKPQLIIFKGGPATENYAQPSSGLTKYHLAYNIWLYITADLTGSIIVETAINNIADAIDATMQSRFINGVYTAGGAFGERNTLGGLINNAWIDGGSEWSREFQDGNCVIMWRILVDTGI